MAAERSSDARAERGAGYAVKRRNRGFVRAEAAVLELLHVLREAEGVVRLAERARTEPGDAEVLESDDVAPPLGREQGIVGKRNEVVAPLVERVLHVGLADLIGPLQCLTAGVLLATELDLLAAIDAVGRNRSARRRDGCATTGGNLARRTTCAATAQKCQTGDKYCQTLVAFHCVLPLS